MTFNSSSEEDANQLSPPSRKPMNRARRLNRRLLDYALLVLSLTFILMVCIELCILKHHLSVLREELVSLRSKFPEVVFASDNSTFILEDEFKKIQIEGGVFSPNSSHILTTILSKAQLDKFQRSLGELWRVTRNLNNRIIKLERSKMSARKRKALEIPFQSRDYVKAGPEKSN